VSIGVLGLANLGGGGPYWAIHRIPKIAQYLCTVRLETGQKLLLNPTPHLLTPASTLVISRTLIPAKGRDDALLAAVVANRLLAGAFVQLALIHDNDVWTVFREDISIIFDKITRDE
jgi:hypothetical protein